MTAVRAHNLLAICVHYYADSNCCEAEACVIEESKLEKVQWIACDECNRWFHKYCCGLLEGANPKYFGCMQHS